MSSRSPIRQDKLLMSPVNIKWCVYVAIDRSYKHYDYLYDFGNRIFVLVIVLLLMTREILPQGLLSVTSQQAPANSRHAASSPLLAFPFYPYLYSDGVFLVHAITYANSLAGLTVRMSMFGCYD